MLARFVAAVAILADEKRGVSNDPNSGGGDRAAAAFESLRAEVALLQLSVHTLVTSAAPDYTPTLGQIDQKVTLVAQRIEGLAKSPAWLQTPAAVRSQIAIAPVELQKEVSQLNQIRSNLEDAMRSISNRVESARARDRQNNWLISSAALGFSIGVLFFALLIGPLTRALPESWHKPEILAANALDLPMWDAGERLLAVNSPERWNFVLASVQLVEANRPAIDACRTVAAKAGKAVRCVIKIR